MGDDDDDDDDDDDTAVEEALIRWSETGIIPRRKTFLVWLLHRLGFTADPSTREEEKKEEGGEGETRDTMGITLVFRDFL